VIGSLSIVVLLLLLVVDIPVLHGVGVALVDPLIDELEVVVVVVVVVEEGVEQGVTRLDVTDDACNKTISTQ
jgi:hypothetical protein